MGRIFLPTDMEVVVASFGGVGTTFLISYLEQYRRVNHFDDEDGIKHLPVPPISLNKEIKFVYVFGNPILAVLSLFRREYHHLHSRKLQKCRPHGAAPVPQAMTLQEYAEAGVDRFFFREHFYNWYDTYLSPVPTLFIRYETLFENVGPLLDFLELPPECLQSFPARKSRHSVLADIPEATRMQLNTLYGAFARELECLDDVEIRCRAEGGRIAPYLRGAYLRACRDQVMFEGGILLRRLAPALYSWLQKLKSGN